MTWKDPKSLKSKSIYIGWNGGVINGTNIIGIDYEWADQLGIKENQKVIYHAEMH